MRKRALVLGGTRYFGIELVRRLIADGYELTLASDGTAPEPDGFAVPHRVIDRHDIASLKSAFSNEKFDLVWDLTCDTPLAAKNAVLVFRGKISHYVMASSIEVYRPEATEAEKWEALVEESERLPEAASVELKWPWHNPTFLESNRAEGKRQAESVLAAEREFPATLVRLAHVLDANHDVTGRLESDIRRVLYHERITLPVNGGQTSFISAEEAADFLVWSGKQRISGAINACATGTLNAIELTRLIGSLVGRVPDIVLSDRGFTSAFAYPFALSMSSALAEARGYRFSRLDQWLNPLILRIARRNEIPLGLPSEDQKAAP